MPVTLPTTRPPMLGDLHITRPLLGRTAMDGPRSRLDDEHERALHMSVYARPGTDGAKVSFKARYEN